MGRVQVLVAGGDLDDTIDRWFPSFPAADRITVRMLMNMSSGIANPGQAQIDRICADPYSTITPDEMIAIGALLPREPYAPGEGFTYSGFNTFILGRILELTTGADLTTLFDTHLFGPLGMDRSRFAPDGQLEAPLSHGYSLFCPTMPQPTDTTDWALHEAWVAGAVVSTIDDLRTWGLALGAGSGLSPEMLLARITDVAPDSGPEGYGYGLGAVVHVDDATGCALDISHAGAEPGYGSNVVWYSSGSVFALVGNGDGGTGEAMVEVLRALAPVVTPLVIAEPTTSCRPAPAPAPTAVAATPQFTG